MKKIGLILVLGLSIAFLGLSYYWFGDDSAINTITETQEESSAAVQQPIVQENEADLLEVKKAHPVSLQALMNKAYDGRELKTVGVQLVNQFYTRYTINYKSGELDISGIMNVPTGDGPFPVLILNHGYIDPAIYTNGRGLKREQDYLARQGFIVIHLDFRNHAFSDKVTDDHLNLRLGYTEDAINAVYAVKESQLEFFDKDNIGMLGHSMGGGITTNILVTQPNLVKAAVLFAPVSADYKDNFDKWTRRRSEEAADIIEAYGDFENNKDFWGNMSPVNFIENIQTPIMLHHGTADDSVPIEWSENFVSSLEKDGKTVIYHVYPGEPHEFIKAWPQVMSRTTDFFKEHLK